MKKRIILYFLPVLLSYLFIDSAWSQPVNSLTSKEKEEGWFLLFNGKDFTGWLQYNGTSMPANWKIEDNAMKVFTAEDKKPGQGQEGI